MERSDRTYNKKRAVRVRITAKKKLKAVLTPVLALALALLFAACSFPGGLTEEPRSPAPAETESASPFVPFSPDPSMAVPDDRPGDGGRYTSVTLYYVTDEGYLLPVRAEIPWETGIAKACLARLVATAENSNALKRQGLNAPIPAGTRIELAISEGEARVNLLDMPALADYRAEQALFTAVVNTLTGFPSVDTVSVFINGNTAKTANGSSLPAHESALALNVENGTLPVSGSAKPVTLYFPNEAGSLFIPVTRYMEGGGLSKAIGALVSGTDGRGLRSCFPKDTLVLGAAIEGGILTVNLSKDFEAIADTPGLYDLAMQTVLLTAMPYGSIDEVRFTVNGRLFEPPEDIY